jgi:hypothetical protein
MDMIFKIKHYANKVLFTFLGPADLDDHNDPVVQLDREWDERFNSDSSDSPALEAPAAPADRDGEVKAIA